MRWFFIFTLFWAWSGAKAGSEARLEAAGASRAGLQTISLQAVGLQATGSQAIGLQAAGLQTFEVIVVGSEPEGIVAAVAAAQTGAKTLLVTEDARLGGLFVLGGLNSLDLRPYQLVQRGLFERWWTLVGRGAAFDTGRAEAAFGALLKGAGVTVRLHAPPVSPVLSNGRVVGVQVGDRTFAAAQVVDATADGDLAAAAGAPFTVGFGSLGVNERMADTLVFRLEHLDWAALVKNVRARGGAYAQVNGNAVWGSFGGFPAAYRAEEQGVRLRGLNLGRQADGSVLVNALLVYGVDPASSASVTGGLRRARLEAPRIVRYLRALPGFERATYGGVAKRLYIREWRHFGTRCTLSVDDTLNNVVRPDDVAAGNYPLDVQTLTPADNGYVYGVPEVYGAGLCVTLPKRPDDLWIAGKSAGYDPLAAASARVVPFGMALGEAVGVAAADAAQRGRSASAYAGDSQAVVRVRGELKARGAYLPVVKPRAPTGPAQHPYFGAYRTLRRKGLALGGYRNDPGLDQTMPALGFLYLLGNVGTRFWFDDTLGAALLKKFPSLSGDLTPGLALELSRAAARTLGDSETDWVRYIVGLRTRLVLTRGEAYALAAKLARQAGS